MVKSRLTHAVQSGRVSAVEIRFCGDCAGKLSEVDFVALAVKGRTNTNTNTAMPISPKSVRPKQRQYFVKPNTSSTSFM